MPVRSIAVLTALLAITIAEPASAAEVSATCGTRAERVRIDSEAVNLNSVGFATVPGGSLPFNSLKPGCVVVDYMATATAAKPIEIRVLIDGKLGCVGRSALLESDRLLRWLCPIASSGSHTLTLQYRGALPNPQIAATAKQRMLSVRYD